MFDTISSQVDNPRGTGSTQTQWFRRSPPDAVIPLATPLCKRALQAMPKAPARVRTALVARGWTGRYSRLLFSEIAAELNLPLASVERHAEALTSEFRTAAAAAATPEERTSMTTVTPAYQKPETLTLFQSDVWDEIVRRGLPIERRISHSIADEIKRKAGGSSPTSVWTAQEGICKKLGIECVKNLRDRIPAQATPEADLPHTNGHAAASAEVNGVVAEITAMNEPAAEPTEQLVETGQALSTCGTCAELLARNAELSRLVGHVEGQRDDVQRRLQEALADREQLLAEVAKAHDELDVADVRQEVDSFRLSLPDRISLLASREAAAEEAAAAPAPVTLPSAEPLRDLLIRNLVALSDRDSVHRAADLFERTVLQ